MIVVLGGVLHGDSRPGAIAFAVLGAILQTAFLGLLYEVILRRDVEDATLERIGLAASVRDHGLVAIDDKLQLNWQDLLNGTPWICICSGEPSTLLGPANDQLLRLLAQKRIRQIRFAVPAKNWIQFEAWFDTFRRRIPEGSGVTPFALQYEPLGGYEVIATSEFVFVAVRGVDANGSIPGRMMLQFRADDNKGVGNWFRGQIDQIMKQGASRGPSRVDLRSEDSPGTQEQVEQPVEIADALSEELT